ncbi:MAG: polysaccharide deacetylase [Candidatus Rokuibacteriota bacterium]|nr:MAG: polysaccharide deacetylase [Candidatus Rokubacteria bacterium]
MTTRKPIASLSLDLDNKWSYLKTHGDPGWERLPSYLDLVVPRVLDFLKARNLTITVFVVGQDAAVAKNRELLRAIAAAGHEIGNHSFHHEPWLHLYSEARTETELERAEEHIERATGRRPLGFRGPGFSLSAASVRVLARRGYRYDASTLPTFLGPLARAYYFMRTRLSPEQREQRKVLYGTFAEGWQPLRPYRWRTDAGEILEIPVTTMPIFKVPIHVSYLLYLSALAPSLAVPYFSAALSLCRWTATQPSLLLHPLDFLGCDDTPDLAFFPAMNLPRERKLELVGRVLDVLSARFAVCTMEAHAEAAARTPHLPVREPRLTRPAQTRWASWRATTN